MRTKQEIEDAIAEIKKQIENDKHYQQLAANKEEYKNHDRIIFEHYRRIELLEWVIAE